MIVVVVVVVVVVVRDARARFPGRLRLKSGSSFFTKSVGSQKGGVD
jgi:hypothetical protein